MSTGGLYQLIANTGMQDQLILATDLLNRRLREIKRIRCKNPAIRDKTPTLTDIERTHVLFMNSHFKPFVSIGYEYQGIGVSQGEAVFGGLATYSIPQFGDFFGDMVLHLQLTGLTVGSTSQQTVYCDFLGHNICSQIQFEVNGNVIDQYTPDLYNFYYNFFVHDSKKQTDWLNCMGQEVPKTATLTQSPLVDEYREIKYVLDGNQTPKKTHSVVDLWIPIMFWFSRDIRLMIPSVSIPYGQRFINVQFNTVNNLCQGLPTPDFTPPIITVADLWINNIFVNPEIHDIFIKRIGFQLIRVYRYQTLPLNTNFDQIRLDQLKWPVETLYIGIRPTINYGTMQDWYKFHFVEDIVVPYPVAQINPNGTNPSYIIAIGQGSWKKQTRIIDTFSIQTHGINLYLTTPVEFFNSYIPFTYGDHVSSPQDIGAYMVTFNLYPGTYQPSGHINLSNSREFFFIYNSSLISSVLTAYLTVYAVCINFLLIASGTASLRYNT